MPRLNQIIALTAGKKGQVQKKVNELYHKIQKPELLAGITRSYKPKDEDGEQLPAERKDVQVKAAEILREASAALTELFDVILTQDFANCEAKANVAVDGIEVAHAVPVTYLLFLEKQLTDLGSLVEKLPTLDPAERWSYSDGSDCYVTESYQSVKTKRVLKNHVKAAATVEHPAQVETYAEDVPAGYWTTVKMSGALPAKEKNALLERVRKLQDAVKCARESANSIEVKTKEIGKSVFSYLFGIENTKSAS